MKRSFDDCCTSSAFSSDHHHQQQQPDDNYYNTNSINNTTNISTISSDDDNRQHQHPPLSVGMAPSKKIKKNSIISYFHNLNNDDTSSNYYNNNKTEEVNSTMVDTNNSSGFELISCFGSYGNQGGQFKNPSDVAIDFTYQLIFICDTDNSRVQVFDESTLNFKCSFKTAPFKPNSISVHWDHSLIISFTRDSLICKYDYNGNEIWRFGGPSTKNIMDSPTGVVVDFEGNIYVCDWFKHRIIVFSPSGQLLRFIGSMGNEFGQFSFPRDVDMDGAGNLIVTDSGNSRLQILKSSGEFISSFGSLGVERGEFQSPSSVCVDKSTGFIYLTEWDSHRVSKFHPNNVFSSGTTCIGGFGQDEMSFKYPSGIAFCYGSSRLLVVDCGNHQLKIYRVS